MSQRFNPAPPRCHAGACHEPADGNGPWGPLCSACYLRMVALFEKLRGKR